MLLSLLPSLQQLSPPLMMLQSLLQLSPPLMMLLQSPLQLSPRQLSLPSRHAPPATADSADSTDS